MINEILILHHRQGSLWEHEDQHLYNLSNSNSITTTTTITTTTPFIFIMHVLTISNVTLCLVRELLSFYEFPGDDIAIVK